MIEVTFVVNGEAVIVDVEPRMTLADCIREKLGLTGVHIGCAHGICGACTVIMDGAAIRACLLLAVQAEGATIQTVENLACGDDLAPLQAAFRKHHALQCGFCTPGMLMTLHALLSSERNVSESRIREVLAGNLCRCTGYLAIVTAALEARDYYSSINGSPHFDPPEDGQTDAEA